MNNSVRPRGEEGVGKTKTEKKKKKKNKELIFTLVTNTTNTERVLMYRIDYGYGNVKEMHFRNPFQMDKE